MIVNKFSNSLSSHQNLKTISGFGPETISLFCSSLGIDPHTPLKDLPSRKRKNFYSHVSAIAKFVSPQSYNNIPSILIDKNLRDFVKTQNKKEIERVTIKGIKKKHFLPCRGQRTKTNAKSAKVSR